MTNLEQITEFFRLMTIINAVGLIIASVALMIFKDMMGHLHARLFGLSEEQVHLVGYQFLGFYKVMLIVFNLAPFLALFIIS